MVRTARPKRGKRRAARQGKIAGDLVRRELPKPKRIPPAALLPATSLPVPPATARWTFLTNHSHVLILLSANPSIVLREVAARVGITERAVQRIIAELEEGGFIEREKVGRRNRYRIRLKRPLRHPIESHRSVRDLLQLGLPGPA